MDITLSSTKHKSLASEHEDHKHSLKTVCDDFDQTTSLCAPPFPEHYHLKTLVDGVHRGDTLFDAMPLHELLRVVRTGVCAAVTTSDAPDWLDCGAVARGQRVHMKHFYAFLVSLTGGLLHGFVIGRFSEVLVMAGYVVDDWTTFSRYRDTSSGTAINGKQMFIDVFKKSAVACACSRIVQRSMSG